MAAVRLDGKMCPAFHPRAGTACPKWQARPIESFVGKRKSFDGVPISFVGVRTSFVGTGIDSVGVPVSFAEWLRCSLAPAIKLGIPVAPPMNADVLISPGTGRNSSVHPKERVAPARPCLSVFKRGSRICLPISTAEFRSKCRVVQEAGFYGCS